MEENKATRRLDMRISQAQLNRVEGLMKKKALSRSGVVNLAIKELADREGIDERAEVRKKK